MSELKGKNETTRPIAVNLELEDVESMYESTAQSRLYIEELESQLEQAQARIKELEQANEWISVDDRLPDNTRPEVLFFIAELNQIELGKFNESTEKWIVPHRDTYYRNGFNLVTHWKPLPQPPESE